MDYQSSIQDVKNTVAEQSNKPLIGAVTGKDYFNNLHFLSTLPVLSVTVFMIYYNARGEGQKAVYFVWLEQFAVPVRLPRHRKT